MAPTARARAFVGVDAHVRDVVARQPRHVASHLGRCRPALASEHFVHDRRRGRRAGSGGVGLELIVVVSRERHFAGHHRPRRAHPRHDRRNGHGPTEKIGKVTGQQLGRKIF